MQSIIYFDIAAIAVMLVLIFTVFFKRILFDNVSRIFISFCVVVLFTAIASMLTVYLSMNPSPQYTSIRYALHTMYLLLRNLNGPLYVLYIIALLDIQHKYQHKKRTFFILMPFVCVVILLASNAFSHLVFCIDDNLEYVRGSHFPLLYLSAAFYMIVGLFYLTRDRRLLQLQQRVSLYSLVFLTAIALGVQWKYPHVTVEMLANALSFILMLIMVQQLDNILDPITGLKTRNFYASDMWRNFENEKPMDVIIVHLSNYSALLAMLGFERMNALMLQVIEDIKGVKNPAHNNVDTYYINWATYAIVLSCGQRDCTGEVVDEIQKLRHKRFDLNQMEINLQIETFVLRCPEEIQDYESLMVISNDVQHNSMNDPNSLGMTGLLSSNYIGLVDKLGAIIENALINDGFEVYYQPIYSLQEKRFASAEALLRLKDEEYGYISPAVFIPLAEKSGAIHRIGDFVMEQVCQFVSSEEFEKLGVDFIEVNLSVAQCMRKDLADSILRTMYKYNVPTNRINLEITETAASFAQQSMVENLNKLSEVGIQFSLDDYGTGYSNIERVVSLPLKIVKLDKTFVDGNDNPKMWIALQNTIRMMKDMEMEIVVEGVETKELVHKIQELECDYIQGYYFSRPVPKAEFIRFVKANQ